MSSEPCVEVPMLVSAIVSRPRERSQERGPGEPINAVGQGNGSRAPASRPANSDAIGETKKRATLVIESKTALESEAW